MPKMSLGFLAFFAVIPILVSVFLRHVSRKSRIIIIPISCLLAAIISVLIWRTPIGQVATSFLQGLVISMQLILLMICVIFCMETLRAAGIIDALRPAFAKIHTDRRVQAILVAWFFEAGVENVIGFASTGGICAIILYGIGFPPACAIMLSVLGLAIPSTFGTGGAPILFGVAKGLEYPTFMMQFNQSGWSMPAYLRLITAQVGIINGIAGIFMPLIMIIMMHRFFGRRQTWKAGLSFAPFAIFCGLAFAIPYTLTAIYIGPQLPSLIAACIGFAIALTAARLGFLLPKESWDFPSHSEWPKTWTGGPYRAPSKPPKLSWWLVWGPFIALAAFIILANVPGLRIMYFFENLALHQWLATNFSIDPFYLFLSEFLLLLALIQLVTHDYEVIRESLGQRMLIPVFHSLRSLPFIMPMVRIYTDSDINPLKQPGMFRSMAEWVAQLPFSQYWMPFFAPLFGAGATHYTVNKVYSNLTLSSFQYQLGQMLNANGSLFIALQVIGASAGCMFAMHYLIGTSIAINRTEVVGPVGRKTLIAMLIHLFIVGILGVLALNVFHLPERLMHLYGP